MEPVVQTIPLPDNMSFVAQTCGSPYFETGWHKHSEHELILFLEGSGTACIGQNASRFEPGDVFLLGSNLPHAFQKNNKEYINAVVIHFRDNCWGAPFINLPECRHIKELLELAYGGLKITGASQKQLTSLIKTQETLADANRIIGLLQCLQLIAASKEYVIVSILNETGPFYKSRDCIDRIFQFTLDSFRDPISLSKVATLACMSISAFCHYFKRRTQKTYIDFLNEVRIGYACHQLLQTDKPITDIGYESGYNTVAYFHRQFLRIKKTTPGQYRKTFSLLNVESIN